MNNQFQHILTMKKKAILVDYHQKTWILVDHLHPKPPKNAGICSQCRPWNSPGPSSVCRSRAGDVEAPPPAAVAVPGRPGVGQK